MVPWVFSGSDLIILFSLGFLLLVIGNWDLLKNDKTKK